MSYTAPSGNAIEFQNSAYVPYWVPYGDSVNFNDRHRRVYGAFADLLFGSSYSAPTTDAADFSFVIATGVPKYAIVSSSTTSFKGNIPKTADFALTSGSSTYFEHPYREFSIPGTSVATFVTDQRHFSIDSTSTPVFRLGVQMRVASASSLDYYIQIPRIGDYAISSPTVGAFVGAKQVDAAFSVASSSLFRPGRGYIQPLAFVVRTSSSTDFRRTYTASLNFSIASDSATAFKGTGIKQQQFSLSSGSSLAGVARFFVPASAAIGTSSQTSFVGLKSALTTGAVASTSAAAFVSSYSFTPITLPSPDSDAAYVTSRNKATFVLTL